MGTVVKDRLDRAMACKVEGNYPDAIAELQTLLAADDRFAEAHHQLGLVYGFTGAFDDSLAELTKAAELDPTNVSVRIDLALTYAMLGMYDEAKADFEEILRLDPTNDVALKNLVFFN